MNTRIFSCLLILAMLLALNACSSSNAPATSAPALSATAVNVPAAEPTTAVNAAPVGLAVPAQAEPFGTPGLSNRLSDSVKKLLMFDHKVLDSYRIDMSGVEPRI